MINSILVVCEGNICRSPMAQGLLAKRLPNATVLSAGLSASVSRSADPSAIALMAERGVDISGHLAERLSLSHIRSAQLVLVMNRMQRTKIEACYPFSTGKVYRLGEHDGVDVIDPYCRGMAAFEAALTHIERGVTRWLDSMIRLTK